MDVALRERILRSLENMSDERGYQLLDYVEFLESKYAARSNPNNFFSRITDTVQDTMRAGKLPISAISGTVGIFDGASKVMKGVAAAAATVVDEASRTAKSASQTAKDLGASAANAAGIAGPTPVAPPVVPDGAPIPPKAPPGTADGS